MIKALLCRKQSIKSRMTAVEEFSLLIRNHFIRYLVVHLHTGLVIRFEDYL